MRLLRRLVQFCLGAQTVISLYLGVVSLVSSIALRGEISDEDLSGATYALMMLTALGFPLLGALPGVAWWTLRKRKPSARRWALAASILNALLLLPVIEGKIHLGRTPSWPLYAVCGTIGILGLIAFWRGDKTRSPKKLGRIAGDGTSTLKDFAAQGISIGIVWVSFMLWRQWAGSHGLAYPGLFSFIAQMESAVLLTTFGHELGHLVAGWAAHKRLRSFQAGPFRWAIRNGIWKFEFNLRKFYGGSVGMVTPDLINVRSRKAFSLIGGPVASLVMGSLCIVAALLTPGGIWQPYWVLLSMMATFSISAFIVNLIPLKPESQYSDGAQLYQIMTNGPWARVHFAFAMVTTSLVSPVRPRDFDVNALKQAADSVPQGERGLLLRLFACLHYFDAGKIPEAIAAMQDAEALYAQSKFDKPQDICAEFVFLNAFCKQDLAAADLWWRRIEALPKVDPDADYWRAKTALLWLKGERDQACETWERGRALALKLPVAGQYELTRSCFAKLRAALDAPVPTTPPPLETWAAQASEVPVPVEA
jgi:hypothetical protein